LLTSNEHLLAVATIAVITAALVVAARLRPGPWTKFACIALAVILVGAEVSWLIYHANTSEGAAWVSALPLQLCDAGIFIAASALVTRKQLLVEMTYFWGLAGTIQAVITPDLPQHFPDYLFLEYYIAHGGIVAAALFLVVGLGQWPRRDAVDRVALITILYALLVGVIDVATGANFMYLRSKPASASLLDLLGPWPFYIFWASLVGFGLLLVLDSPFRWLRGRRQEHTL
jgi:hypothetical integral membrane protein (TIGR02206 family)